MFWWGLVIVVLVAPSFSMACGVGHPRAQGIDREQSKECFRAEQELRGLRRSAESDLASGLPSTKPDSSDVPRLPADSISR